MSLKSIDQLLSCFKPNINKAHLNKHVNFASTQLRLKCQVSAVSVTLDSSSVGRPILTPAVCDMYQRKKERQLLAVIVVSLVHEIYIFWYLFTELQQDMSIFGNIQEIF